MLGRVFRMPTWDTGLGACSDFPKPFHTGAWQEPERWNRPEKQIQENPTGEGWEDPARATSMNGHALHGACNLNGQGEAEQGCRRDQLDMSHYLHSP